MSAINRYFDNLANLIVKLNGNHELLEEASQLIARSLAKGGLIHVFGTGHSHVLAEEMFYRAGGLGAVNPILEEDLMLHVSASRSTSLERRGDLADKILQKQSINPSDVFILISNSGGNALIEAMAKRLKKQGVPLIAITSLQHATSPLARTSGTKLHELADIVLDNFGILGDASVTFPDSAIVTGPTSTVIGTAIINALSSRAVELLLESGIEPEVFGSSNSLDGDKKNDELIRKFQSRISIL